MNTAIEVNTSFDKFKTCDLFPNYDENYLILQNATDGFANIVEGFQEGATSGNTIQTCIPIDDNDKDESNGLIVNYLNGNQTSQNKTIDLLFAIIIFIIVTLLSAFVSPGLYKNVFNTTLNDQNLNQTALFCFFYLLLASCLLGGGIAYDYPSAVTGLMLLIFFGMSFIFIYNRVNIDNTFLDLESGLTLQKVFAGISTAFTRNISNIGINYRNIFNVNNNYVMLIGVVVTSILFGIFAYSNSVNSGKMKNKKFPEKNGKAPKNSAYMNYVYTMLGIFGYGYSLFVFGPFFYAVNSAQVTP